MEFLVVLVFVLIVGFIVIKDDKSNNIIDSQTQKRQKETQSRKPIRHFRNYQNHCWSCKSDINSHTNQVCPKCNFFYICNDCGKCYCDSPFYIRKH